jgi:hypothetical protein
MQEIDLRTGRVVQLLSLPGLHTSGPRVIYAARISSSVFLPHSSTIAYVRDLNTVAFLPPRGHKQIQPPDPSCNEIDAIAASPPEIRSRSPTSSPTSVYRSGSRPYAWKVNESASTLSLVRGSSGP